jgi:hypothetical protein
MRKYWLAIALAVIVIVGVGGYFGLQEPLLYGRIGTTYAAKQTCSCMFVSGRSLQACEADLPGAAGNMLTLSVSGHQVKASAYGVVHASATFEEGYGCRVDS